MKIHGWGRFPRVEAQLHIPRTRAECASIIQCHDTVTPRGNGRGYGDSALGDIITQSSHLDHYIEFNPTTGILRCEAGVLLNDILDLIVPSGWFLPVTPGTSLASIAGCIASDVHGKNHHGSGTFSQYILSFDLMLGSGEILTVSKSNFPDLFRATCGGMGLTGLIINATIQLKPIQSSQILQNTLKAQSLEEVCTLFEINDASTYSVAWIDCQATKRKLGRSLLMLGEHSSNGDLTSPHKKPLNIHFDMPSGLLNRYSVKGFNALYFNKELHKQSIKSLPYKPYFYPLDALQNWNKLYGKNGFAQYQFVLPIMVGVNGLKKVLSAIAESGEGSFLAVLKMFGEENSNYLSFPLKGYTLALDFKINHKTLKLIKKLDDMIIDMGGRIYLAKDALMSEHLFKIMYPNWEVFEEVRSKYGALGKFSSHQSKRLGLQ